MVQDTSDSQEEQRSSSTNLTPAELDHQATLREDFALAKLSELGRVLFYERSLENGGKMILSAFVNKDRAWLYYWQVDEDNTLSAWCKQAQAHGQEAFPGKGHQTPLEEENHRLKRELERVQQERDILKKP